MNFPRPIKNYVTVQLVAFIGLAGATFYAVDQGQNNARTARNELAVSTFKTQQAGCSRTNDLRQGISAVLVSIADQPSDANQSEENRRATRVFFTSQLPKFRPIDCARAYPEPKLEK